MQKMLVVKTKNNLRQKDLGLNLKSDLFRQGDIREVT